jgi:glycosidase
MFEYVEALLRLRREYDALRAGKLWHLESDDSSYVFLRDSDEEKLVVAFHNGKSARDMAIELEDTPGKQARGILPVFGTGQAELAGQALRLHLPPESLSIFALQ